MKRLSDLHISVLDVEVLPDDPATENQISFLFSLGHLNTNGLTKQEASSVIDNILQKRQTADRNVFMLATTNRTETTRFDSKNTVYWKIFQHQISKSDYDLACWYVFRVYRSCINKSNPEGIYEIYHPIFKEIAHSILSQPSLVASLKRSASASKNGFRWFGSFTTNGHEIQGESTRTQLYIHTISELKLKFPPQISIQSAHPKFYNQEILNNTIGPLEEKNKNGIYVFVIWVSIAVFFLMGWLFR